MTDNLALQLDAFVTPGTLLKAVREEQSLATAEVAERLHWMPGYVEIIESDNYQALLSPAFARSYVKAYGRLLALDEKQLLDTFDEFCEGREAMSPRQVQSRPLQLQRTGFGVIIGLAVLGLLIFALWWWQIGAATSTTGLAQSVDANGNPGMDAVREADKTVAGDE